MNSPVPPGGNDLSQSFCIVLICLVDLHLEGGACAPRVETNDFQPEIAEFMHKPRCHRSGFDAYASVISRMAADKNPDLFWNCVALTPPESPASKNHLAASFYRGRLMGWSGCVPAPRASKAGELVHFKEHAHVQQKNRSDRRDRHRYRQELVSYCWPRQAGRDHSAAEMVA